MGIGASPSPRLLLPLPLLLAPPPRLLAPPPERVLLPLLLDRRC